MVSSLSSPLRSSAKDATATRSAHKSGDSGGGGGDSSKDKEVSRYEFDSKVPKGQRTDRDKKRVKRTPVAPGDREREPPGGDALVDHTKHLKRLRTSRYGASRKLRSDREEEVDAKLKDENLAVHHEGPGDAHRGVEAECCDKQDNVGEHQTEEGLKVSADQQDVITGVLQGKTVSVVDEADEAGNEPTAVGEGHTRTETHQEKIADQQTGMDLESGAAAHQDEKLVHAEPEPDTSLSLGLSNSHRAPNRTRSVQSMSQAETLSYGITTSLSLSCSHPFTHNPSCSLTHNSHDHQEFSSGSQPMRPEASGGGSRKMEVEDARSHAFKGKAASESNHFPRPRSSMHRKQVKSSASEERWNERGGATAGLRVPTVHEVVADPIPVAARKLQSLPLEVLDALKASVKDLLERGEPREEFLHLQRILQSRTDMTPDVLHASHRTQLEVLVAVKTGNPAFLMQENHQLKPLIEVFLNSRCRNLQCSSQLPVDNCECKICTQKNGFCNACMCVVCSKFDGENNTCSWVGCDYCIHWCHTDCGLRKGYIKSGPTLHGTSEMQFHCTACGHSSELFGFVKEVFASCVKSWSRGILLKELDCARRMFQGSDDIRGKQLCRRAGHLIAKLESNSLDLPEACNASLGLFDESNDVSPSEDDERGCGRIDRSTVLERATLALQAYDRVLEEKRTDAAEMQYERSRKKAEIEELESIVRIKQAEAKMFQARADEASREAEGLQRIVLAKCLKVEQEYAAKKSKLQLLDAEEKRKQKFEDLQFLERGSSNFDIVRNLMADLQSLLGNMETAKHFEAEEVSGIEAYLHRYLQSR